MDELAVALGAQPILPPLGDPMRATLAIATIGRGCTLRLFTSHPGRLVVWRVSIRVPGAVPQRDDPAHSDAVVIDGSIEMIDGDGFVVGAHADLTRLVNTILLGRLAERKLAAAYTSGGARG